jgi:lysophospholipase
MPGFHEIEYWTAADGARLALRHQPAAARRRAAMIIVHGWGDHGGLYEEAAGRFAAAGFAVFALDQRGAGRSPGPRGHVERFAQYLSDLAALRKHVAESAPGPQVLLGHSFGGFVVLRYLETGPQALAGAIAVAPWVDYHTPPPRWKATAARLLADVAPRLRIPTGLDYQRRTRDRNQNTRIYQDPDCHHVMTPRAYREATAALEALRRERTRISTPLLVVLASEDYLVSTPAARDFSRSLGGDVTLEELDGMFHDVFHEPDRERAYAAIGGWLDRVLGA